MKKHGESLFQIGEITKIMGVTRKTLLVFEEMGLLTPAVKDEESGYRYYSADNMTQIRAIRSLQALGLTLKEVAEYYYDRENIERYFHYRGIMQLWGTFRTRNDRFAVTALVNPTITFARYNVQMEASWRMAKRGDWLPALFVQYCYGYGETMIDYNRRASKIRIGISLTNNKINLY